MNRLNRKVEYALMGLKKLCESSTSELISVSEICTSTGAPFDATSRVMQQLVQAGILNSEHGAKGGYKIAKVLSAVSFYELIYVVLGPLEIVRCIGGGVGDVCDLSPECNVKSPLRKLNSKMIEFYKSISVAELVASKSERSEQAWPAQIEPQI